MVIRKYYNVCAFLSVAIMLLSSCATDNQSVKALPSANTDRLEGIWVDPETRCSHTIVRTDKGFAVTGVNDEDEAPEEGRNKVLSSEWKDNTFTWTYFVQQTGYTVTFRFVSLNDDKLEAEWKNDDGKGVTNEGKEILYRKESIPAPEETDDKGTAE